MPAGQYFIQTMQKLLIYILFIISIFSGCRSNLKLDMNNISKGEKLFSDVGCIACHSVTGEKKYGPSLNNIVDKEVNVIREEKTRSILIDRRYILRSVRDPDYEKVDSFRKQTMPVPTISEEDIKHIVDYLMYINDKK